MTVTIETVLRGDYEGDPEPSRSDGAYTGIGKINDNFGNVKTAVEALETAPPAHVHSSLAASDGSPDPALSVDADGKVGLGTPTPDANLHIYSATAAAKFKIETTGDFTTQWNVHADRDTSGESIFQMKANWVNTQVAQIAMNVGDDTINKDNGLIVFKTSNGSGVTERMRIDPDGNVGINTTPSEKLDVAGSANITGAYKINAGVSWSAGSGSPESVVTAPIGSLYSRTDGGAGTSFYVKESGTGNTGWVAK